MRRSAAAAGSGGRARRTCPNSASRRNRCGVALGVQRKRGSFRGWKCLSCSSGDGLGPLVPRGDTGPVSEEAAWSLGRNLCPSLRLSPSTPRPFGTRSRSLLGFVNNNKCRGSSLGIPCSPVPCPPADVTERRDPRQAWLSDCGGCLCTVPKNWCVRLLNISQTQYSRPAAPRSHGVGKARLKICPLPPGTVDPSFRHNFLLFFFSHLYYLGQTSGCWVWE